MKKPPISARILVPTAIAVLAISGCAAQTGPDTSPTAVDAPVTSAPDDPPDALAFETEGEAPADSVTQRMVDFEAAWQCDLARFAVDELAGIDAILAEHRMDFEVTDAVYSAFQAELAIDVELRALVASQTSECLDAGESVQL